MNEVSVRKAGLPDCEVLACFQEEMALATEDKRLDPATIRAGVRAVFEEPSRGFYFIAVRGESVIGALFVTTEWSDWRNGDFWWIQSVFVLEGERRQGVYRRLHDEVRRLAREQGDIVGIRLYVEKENEVAQATYRRMGMCEMRYLLFEGEVRRD